jgi:hypothetical protein
VVLVVAFMTLGPVLGIPWYTWGGQTSYTAFVEPSSEIENPEYKSIVLTTKHKFANFPKKGLRKILREPRPQFDRACTLYYNKIHSPKTGTGVTPYGVPKGSHFSALRLLLGSVHLRLRCGIELSK